MSTGTSETLVRVVILALWVGGCGLDEVATQTVEGAHSDAGIWPVETHMPPSLEGIRLQVTDDRTRWVGVRCMTCHGLREGYEEHDLPDHDPRELENVHRGLFYRHGALKCRACHDPERPDRLRLADGTTLELTDALRLCAQCHGPNARDWEAGSHGGRRGFWDRSRGPALRNHCVDCHDPHDPRFPAFRPAPPPRDRFMDTAPPGETEGGHDE